MDFFARQDLARRKTRWLMGYFALAVLGLILAVYFLILLVGGGLRFYADNRYHYHPSDQGGSTLWGASTWWNPPVLGGSALGVLVVVFCGSAYRINQFSRGGSTVAMLMGGEPVLPNTTDPDERKLLNVVEEMAIASGVPMPEVYVLPNEPAINAFAAGHTTGDAAITVTRGAIQCLTRDELQGVVGHEFSHVLNGDMRLNLRLMGLVFGLLCIATIGRLLLNVRVNRGRGNGAPQVIGLGLLAIGSIGVLFGRLIQAAVCRQREFLADASSVQFTRNPAGLAGALRKIGGHSEASRLRSDHAPDLCHCFFGNAMREPFFDPLATHPPISERIRAIDPQWDGRFQTVMIPNPERPKVDVMADVQVKITANQDSFSNIVAPNVAGMAVVASVLAPSELSVEVNDETKFIPAGNNYGGVLANVGYPTTAHLAYAGQLVAELPESLKAAVREPVRATAFVCALLLAGEETLRADQLKEIGRRLGTAVSDDAAMLYGQLTPLARRERLPLVNLAIGAMRRLTAVQYQDFTETLEWLVDSDGQLELFEFVVQRSVQRHLAPLFGQTARRPVQYYVLGPLLPDAFLILSALANLGSTDPAACDQAFAAGVTALCLPLGSTAKRLPLEQCGLDPIGTALDHLVQAAPQLKRRVLAACGAVVGVFGTVSRDEAELLRAIADSLDCPVPPALGGE